MYVFGMLYTTCYLNRSNRSVHMRMADKMQKKKDPRLIKMFSCYNNNNKNYTKTIAPDMLNLP